MRQLIRPFLLYPVVAALLLLACSSPQERRELQRLLAEADSMNRNYVDFTTDSVLLRAVSLADRHGSNRDRVRARYLLGCAYRDMGEAPQALDCYHQAIDIADTTRVDCDYLLLSKIHGQAGDLFLRQGLPRNAMEEYKIGERLAWQAKDTLTAILAYGQLVSCYDLLSEKDSIITISLKTREYLLKYKDTLTANTFLGPVVSILLSRKEYEIARPKLELYEKHSTATEGINYSVPNYRLLYDYKGLYALGTGQLDTAAYYFRTLKRYGLTATHHKLAYAGLFEIYCQTGEVDSIKKYGNLYMQTVDTICESMELSRLHDIQGLYNYQRHQEQARTQERKAANMHRWLFCLMLALLLLFSLSYISIVRIKRHDRDKMMELSLEYSTSVMEYKRLEHLLAESIQQNRREEVSYLALQREFQLVSETLARLQSDNKPPAEWDIEDAISDSPIVAKIHHTAASRAMSEDDWQQLYTLLMEHMPNFVAFLASKELAPTMKEYRLCALMRLRFDLSEIRISLDISKQNLSNIRRRLLTKLFGESGNAKDFDRRIFSIPR